MSQQPPGLRALLPKESVLSSNTCTGSPAQHAGFGPLPGYQPARGDATGREQKPVLDWQPGLTTRSEAEWERIRGRFKELYMDEEMALVDAMKALESKCNFKATTDQFKRMIKKWGLRKNITPREYVHMIRKEKQRQKVNPRKRTKFFIDNKPIKRAKIERFKASHPNGRSRGSATPPSVACTTETSDSVLSRFSGGMQAPGLDTEFSLDGSSMAVTSLPSQGSTERAARLWLDPELYLGLFSSIQTDATLIGERPTRDFTAQIRNCPTRNEKDNSEARLSKRWALLSRFEAWNSHKLPDEDRDIMGFENILAAIFPDLILKRDSREADMNHEEKTQQHQIIIVEAGLAPGPEDDDPRQSLQDHLVHEHSYDEVSNLLKESSEAAISPFGTTDASAIAAFLILLNKRTWYSPDRVSSSSPYSVDIPWCVSEIVKNVFRLVMRSRDRRCWLTTANRLHLLDQVLYSLGLQQLLKPVITSIAIALIFRKVRISNYWYFLERTASGKPVSQMLLFFSGVRRLIRSFKLSKRMAGPFDTFHYSNALEQLSSWASQITRLFPAAAETFFEEADILNEGRWPQRSEKALVEDVREGSVWTFLWLALRVGVPEITSEPTGRSLYFVLSGSQNSCKETSFQTDIWTVVRLIELDFDAIVADVDARIHDLALPWKYSHHIVDFPQSSKVTNRKISLAICTTGKVFAGPRGFESISQ